MTDDVDVLIIGAGMSGLGLAIQLIRNYGSRRFEIIEKTHDVGGTWLVNTYPGCGCDVPSHFYSYSFALNPDWSKKFSMRCEIQQYFRNVSERYDLIPHIRFGHSVQQAHWNEGEQVWLVTVYDHKTGQTAIRKAKMLVSAVGSLSVPRPCEIPGADKFQGPLFHSAKWDHSFQWKDKDVVVIGNGCSATQFVPVMAPDAKRLTQFSRQAHFLEERPNPTYSTAFRAMMRYMPGAMRAYRLKLYAEMEQDFAGFDVDSGGKIRAQLKETNERYVKSMAPKRYWNALIPRYEVGCKRRVKDTDYLSTLHRQNVELVPDDDVVAITDTGVRTQSGREVSADAIVLATGFQVFRMLFPMEIYGRQGTTLTQYWEQHHQGAAQAYLGTCVPGFPNFFIMMGPNTVTGHLSVIYTVECQINFALRLAEPVLRSLRAVERGQTPSAMVTSVDVKSLAAMRDSNEMQTGLSKLVWSSGCTSWALDPGTGLNIAMYHEYQFWFWFRSVMIPRADFEYSVQSGTGSGKRRKESLLIGGWRSLRNWSSAVAFAGAVFMVYSSVRRLGGSDRVTELLRDAASSWKLS